MYYRTNKKYNNKKTILDGIKFDSKKEARMYSILKLLEKSKKIKLLKLQPTFVLVNGYIGTDGKKVRDITYSADFSFYDNEQKRYRVLDCKGIKTDVFKLKEKMFNKIMLNSNIKLEYEI